MSSLASRVRGRVFAAVQQAVGQFLALPILVLVAFVMLAALTYVLDDLWFVERAQGAPDWLEKLLGDSASLGSLLSTVASSIITVTSITFSLLLLAVQQGASALSTQVTDQFLMRRSNQFYFGFFVGLSVYVLITLVTVSSIHRPIVGTSVALLLTTVALCLMVLLIYSTIDQMRPGQIVRAIHGHVLRARERELALLGATRRSPRLAGEPGLTLRSSETGEITGLDVACLRKAVEAQGYQRLEIEMLVGVGSYAAFQDPLAIVRVTGGERLDAPASEALETALTEALTFADARSLTSDPCFGIYQLSIIGWTSGSTAKSNPSPAIAAVRALRDILARWAACGAPPEDLDSPVVYADRSALEAVTALEALAVVTSESMQPQTLAEILRAVALLLPQLDPPLAAALADVCRRTLSCLGEHVLTTELEVCLDRLAIALDRAGFGTIAAEHREARRVFAGSVGRLGSRSTRAPPART